MHGIRLIRSLYRGPKGPRLAYDEAHMRVSVAGRQAWTQVDLDEIERQLREGFDGYPSD